MRAICYLEYIRILILIFMIVQYIFMIEQTLLFHIIMGVFSLMYICLCSNVICAFNNMMSKSDSIKSINFSFSRSSHVSDGGQSAQLNHTFGLQFQSKLTFAFIYRVILTVTNLVLILVYKMEDDPLYPE